MRCRIQDLRRKEVVCVRDGCIVGPVCDVEFDSDSAQILAIIVYGRPKLFGLLGREEDCVINWDDIEIIGEDTVLVSCASVIPRKRHGFFGTGRQN